MEQKILLTTPGGDLSIASNYPTWLLPRLYHLLEISYVDALLAGEYEVALQCLEQSSILRAEATSRAYNGGDYGSAAYIGHLAHQKKISNEIACIKQFIRISVNFKKRLYTCTAKVFVENWKNDNGGNSAADDLKPETDLPFDFFHKKVRGGW